MPRLNTGSNANLAALLAREGLDPARLWNEDTGASGLALWPELAGVAEELQGFAEGRILEDPRKAEQFYPLPSGALDWREWLRQTDPAIRIDLMSVEHIKLWRWIESLKLGIRPDAFFADWPRGYGKTTTGRLSMSRLCARGVRRFGLYVCGTLASANASIVSIRSELERQGVRRRESLYGHSLGWSSERIVTENGFTLIALGLDVANIRGLNLDKLRPDFIILDDIDGLTDSPEVSDKKLEIISSTIIPAGSRDCAFLVTQNEIHGHGVVHRIITGEAGILRRRIVSKTVAVQGLEIASVPRGSRLDTETGELVRADATAAQWSMLDAPGEWPELAGLDSGDEVEETPAGVVYEDELQIVGGASTWPGKSLREWEDELNSMGELAFRREMQHELGAGGLFFNFWSERQIIGPDNELTPSLPWHLCDMPRILPHWLIQAGGDYGTASHHAQVIGALDEYGVLYIIGEEGEPNRTDKQQALALLIRLEELGLASGITPNPAMAQPGIGVRDKNVPGLIRSLDRDGHELPQSHRLSAFALDPAGTMPPEGNSAQTAQERMSEYPVEVFRRYGIPVVRAQKNIVAGLGGLRDAMFRTVTYPPNHPTEPGRTVPMLRIVRGQAPLFQRYLETAVKDPKDELRAVSAAKLEHFGDAGRYLRMRAIEAIDPNAPKAMVLKDGTVLPPDTAQWFKDAMKPYAEQPRQSIGSSRYRGTAGKGR